MLPESQCGEPQRGGAKDQLEVSRKSSTGLSSIKETFTALESKPDSGSPLALVGGVHGGSFLHRAWAGVGLGLWDKVSTGSQGLHSIISFCPVAGKGWVSVRPEFWGSAMNGVACQLWGCRVMAFLG